MKWMPKVSDITIGFKTEGADEVQQDQRKVRSEVSETAKTAQKQQGTVTSWMERNQEALVGIGAASAGALYAIARSSETMGAYLDSMRASFSFFAETIAQDVQPALEALEGVLWRISTAYSNLPPGVRKVISYLLLFAAVVGSVLGAASLLIKAVSGISAALGTLAGWLGISTSGLSSAAAAAASAAAPFLAAAAAIIAVVAAAWALETQFGKLGRQINTVFLPIAMGIPGWIYVLETRFGALTKYLDFVKTGFSKLTKGIKGFLDFIQQSDREIISDFVNLFKSWLPSKMKKWGEDAVINFVDGLLSMREKLDSAGDKLKETLKKKLSFDRVANDRMVFSWGIDMVSHMAKGIKSNVGSMKTAAQTAIQSTQNVINNPIQPQGAAPAAGGESYDITIESGAIQLNGVEETVDEDRLTELIINEINDRVGGR